MMLFLNTFVVRTTKKKVQDKNWMNSYAGFWECSTNLLETFESCETHVKSFIILIINEFNSMDNFSEGLNSVHSVSLQKIQILDTTASIHFGCVQSLSTLVAQDSDMRKELMICNRGPCLKIKLTTQNFCAQKFSEQIHVFKLEIPVIDSMRIISWGSNCIIKLFMYMYLETSPNMLAVAVFII